MNWPTKAAAVGLACLVMCSFVASPAWADWDPGQGHKMHFPQLPDLDGWDVGALPLADDWRCTETGPVTDIHLWYSMIIDLGSLVDVSVSIYSDDPDPDGGGPLYSKPKDLLWSRDFGPSEITTRLYATGDQGWYIPAAEFYVEHNHDEVWQCNIVDIEDPFIQQAGEIYWLAPTFNASLGAVAGWKTSLDHFNDGAVYDLTGWQELRDPITDESLDMAFVITGSPIPEPATMLLLALGGAARLIRRRRA